MALPKHVQEQRQELVDKVVKDIQDGKPFFWDCEHYSIGRPRSLLKSTKGEDRYYKGINAMRLTISTYKNDFKDSRWATFKQAQMLGGRIKKGAKGTHIEYWQYKKDVLEINPKTGKKEPVYVINPETGKKEKKQIELEHPIVKSYVVFNGDQIEGIPKEHPITIKPEHVNEIMEDMLKHSEAKIYYDQTRNNFYRPSEDTIHVMPREQFKTLDGFYSTCAHEIAHSTGAPHRLDRDTMKNAQFGSEQYAKEELRAEMTSMFLQQKYNIRFDQKHYENHTAYLQSWAKVLKNDPNELYRAASDAEKAMEYIEHHMMTKKLTKTKTVSIEAKPEETKPKKVKRKLTLKVDNKNSKSKAKSKSMSLHL